MQNFIPRPASLGETVQILPAPPSSADSPASATTTVVASAASAATPVQQIVVPQQTTTPSTGNRPMVIRVGNKLIPKTQLLSVRKAIVKDNTIIYVALPSQQK